MKTALDILNPATGEDFPDFAALGTVAVPALVDDSAMALMLEDLLPDLQGDIVLFNDAGVTEMAIVTEKPLIGSGIVDCHVMADGTDVAGMAYYSFEAGPTLYMPSNVHLSVSPGFV